MPAHRLWMKSGASGRAIYLDIGNEGKINNTFEIVCQWMDKLLIPKMNELCATE